MRRWARPRILPALFVFAAASGVAWVTSLAFVQDAQRRGAFGGSTQLVPSVALQWALVVGVVALPVFVVATGGYIVVFFARRRAHG